MATKRSSRKGGTRPIKISLEELCKDLGIPQWDYAGVDFSEAYGYAYRSAMQDAEEEGMDPDKAEEFAQEKGLEAEQELADAVFRAHENAVEHAIEETLEPANLIVSCEKGQCLISPKVSWDDSAEQIIEVINGIGFFHFNSLREFLDSGPYTAREAVEGHLHHMASYGEVYGTSSPRRLYQKDFEAGTRYL